MTTIIKGKLDPFFETGTEGVIWSVYEDGKEGYEGLHCLGPADFLRVYDLDDPIKVLWEGNIDFEYERNYRKYPMNPEYGQQEIGGMWVHGIQRDVEPADWGNWFYKHHPAELIVAGIGRLFQVKSSTVSGYAYAGRSSYKEGVPDTDGDLILKFKSGGYYRYKDVPNSVVTEFEAAPSKGKHLAMYIKDKYITEKIELPAPEKPKGYSLNKPRPWTKYPDHGADVPNAWPFPTRKKP